MKRIAVFAGTFDPITNGHLDLIKRGLILFDEVIVLVAVNPNKKPYFDVKTRIKYIKLATSKLKHVKVDFTKGLTTEYAKKHKAKYLIRGFRNIKDLNYEIALMNANYKVNNQIETILLLSNSKLKNISSSEIIKKIKKGEDVSPYIPFKI